VNRRPPADLSASVIVATKNRSDRLLRLLDALEHQEGGSLEVVVVDDGSTDRTAEKVAELLPSLQLSLRVIRQDSSTGPAAARNVGWRMANAPVVLFTDDDCVPVGTWARSLLARIEDENADIATGVTTFPDSQADLRDMWAYWMVDDGQRGQFSTCNIAYRRDVLESLGGFDEGFRYRTRAGNARGMNGEDTDLAWRALEAGFRTAFAPEAVVYHDVFPQSWRQYLRNMRRLEGIVLLYKKHPQLRRHWGRRLVYRSEDVAALAVLGGVVGLGVRRLRPLVVTGVLGAAWHTWVYRRYRQPPADRGGYLVAVPLGLVADSFAALVMLRASIRYRTLLI
jgi:GT2 family glycosyltransferase